MNNIDELKQFVIVHARAQNIPQARYEATLARITNDDDGVPGSWAREWSAAGRCLDDTAPLDAARCYNMARFPFVDGPARRDALASCVNAVGRWRDNGQPGIERIDIDLPQGRIGCWAGGLATTSRRPVVIVMGGIVSIKEQWVPIALLADRLGMAVVVAEMPGVGENTVPYDPAGWQVFPALLDAIADRAETSQVYAVALSFSGHLALRWAQRDHRLRGLVTVGAPIRHFYTDPGWFGQLPRVTVDTLAHLTRTPADDLFDLFHDWALDDELLASLDIPVYYTASTRDEIIPAADLEFLRKHLKHLHVNEYDDVHGSPEHTEEIRLWVPHALLRMSGRRAPQRLVLSVLLSVMRLRRGVLDRS
jgi:esterase FrsA